jgi:GNAT superfamily N-acetyltransferase
MGIEVRMLGPGDEQVLARVADDVFDEAIDAEAARAFVADPRHHVAVAIDGGVVIGFVSGVHYFHPDKPRPEMWINEVGVAPTHQGRGVGKELLRAFLDAARGMGCVAAWVLTDRENAPAMRLYAAGGGVPEPPSTTMFTFRLGPDRPQAS